MKILSGIYQRYSGDITLFKKKVIAIFHQELNMCKHLTVAENIFLGREIRKRNYRLNNSEMNREAQKILTKLGVDITQTTLVGDLQVSKQQMVEIVKPSQSMQKY